MTATTTTDPLPARPTSLWQSIAAFAAGAALATGATLAFTADEPAEVSDRTPRPAPAVVSQPSAGYPTSADAAERRAIAARQKALERCTDGPRSADAAERCVSAIAVNGR